MKTKVTGLVLAAFIVAVCPASAQQGQRIEKHSTVVCEDGGDRCFFGGRFWYMAGKRNCLYHGYLVVVEIPGRGLTRYCPHDENELWVEIKCDSDGCWWAGRQWQRAEGRECRFQHKEVYALNGDRYCPYDPAWRSPQPRHRARQ